MLLAACISDELEPGATSRTPDPEAVVTIGRGEDGSDWSYCIAPGPALLIQPLRVDGGPVTFGAPSINSDGAALETATWFAPVTEPVESYILTGQRPGSPELEQGVDWARRKQLSGATLADGDYALFVQTSAPRGTALRDGTFPWTAGEQKDSSTAPWALRFASDCGAESPAD